MYLALKKLEAPGNLEVWWDGSLSYRGVGRESPGKEGLNSAWWLVSASMATIWDWSLWFQRFPFSWEKMAMCPMPH